MSGPNAQMGVALSAMWAPSWIWFLLIAVLWAVLLLVHGARGRRLRSLIVALVAVVAVGLTPDTLFHADDVVWSPYQLLTLFQAHDDPQTWHIMANRTPYQSMIDVSDQAVFPSVPYQVARSVRKRKFRQVLIVGAGSGTDVAMWFSVRRG